MKTAFKSVRHPNQFHEHFSPVSRPVPVVYLLIYEEYFEKGIFREGRGIEIQTSQKQNVLCKKTH